MSYKVVKSIVEDKGRFKFHLDQVEKDGSVYPYSYVEVIEGVSVLAFHLGKVVLLQEYRHPIQEVVYELPSGMIDAGESPEEAAVRELKEETGYEAVNMKSLGFFYPSFGSTNEKIHLFLCECGKRSMSETDALEELELCEIDPEDLEQLTREGKFLHSAGLAAWLKYRLD